MATIETRAHCCDCEQRKLRSLNTHRNNMMFLFYAPVSLTMLIATVSFIAFLANGGIAK